MKHIVLILIFTLCNAAYAGEDEKALRKAGEAAVKHFKIDRMLKRFEKRYIHDDVRTYGGYTITVADIIIKQRITYEWTF